MPAAARQAPAPTPRRCARRAARATRRRAPWTPGDAAVNAAKLRTRPSRRHRARRVDATPHAAELTPPRASRRIDAMSPPRARRPLLLALALAALLGGDAAGADLWRWIDADGVPRYTPDPDRVPAAQRSSLVRVDAGMPAVPRPEPAAAAKPPPIFAPPGDPALTADPFNEPERAREVEGEILVEVPTTAPAPALGGPPAPPRDVGPVEAAPAPALPATAVAPEPAPREAARVAAPEGPPSVAAPPVPPPAEPPAVAAPAVRASAEPPAVAAPAVRAPAEPPAAAAAPLPPERAARRKELLAAIERDEEWLKAHVTSGAGPIAPSAELREVAERLPALQAELRALDAQGAAP
jgi:hypothetical protein